MGAQKKRGKSRSLRPAPIRQIRRSMPRAASPDFSCAVKRRWSTVGKVPPGNWFAPPGSNRSSSGGNEAAEASDVKGRVGDLAIMQAVMEVNAEQAPKPEMQEPTRRFSREGRR